jgi:hypothetical protein
LKKKNPKWEYPNPHEHQFQKPQTSKTRMAERALYKKFPLLQKAHSGRQAGRQAGRQWLFSETQKKWLQLKKATTQKPAAQNFEKLRTWYLCCSLVITCNVAATPVIMSNVPSCCFRVPLLVHSLVRV